MVFLENFYSFLLLVHLFATFVLVGSMTHNLFCVRDYLRSKFNRQKLEQLYVKVSLWAYVIVYVIGALIYPAFRVHIRPDFDKELPWATGLFEVKEHWGRCRIGIVFRVLFSAQKLQAHRRKGKIVSLCAAVFAAEHNPLQHCWKWVNEKGVPSQGWYIFFLSVLAPQTQLSNQL